MLRTTGDLPELQQRVRDLDGVAEATVRWPDPHGPAELRVRIDHDSDAADVTGQVLEVLERVGGVDLDTLDLREAEGEAPTRPVFAGLEVQRGELDVQVEVTLRYLDREIRGVAEGLATADHTPRVAAAAALAALAKIVRDDVRLHVEWVEVPDTTAPRSAVVSVAVTCLSPDGQDQHVGSAFVRGDLREATVRATLDAVNRRLRRLTEQQHASDGGASGAPTSTSRSVVPPT